MHEIRPDYENEKLLLNGNGLVHEWLPDSEINLQNSHEFIEGNVPKDKLCIQCHLLV